MKKVIFIIFLIVLFVFLIIFGSYQILVRNQMPKPLFVQEFPEDSDFDNSYETDTYKDFYEKCAKENGGVFTDKNNLVYECYKIADDARQSCDDDSQCESGNCDFSEAINSKVCVLIKTDKDVGKETYTYEYECSQDSPGKCGKIPSNEQEWKMNGNVLVEKGHKNFPQEKKEFAPI